MRIFIPVFLSGLYFLSLPFNLDQPELQSETQPTEIAPSDTLIQMERTLCYGTCPAYVLTIDGNGDVIFEGKEFVSHKGTAEGEISKEKLNELIQFIHEINLMEIPSDPECESRMTDMPSVYLTLEINGSQKKINHYHGCRGFEHEDDLYKFEEAVDSLAGVQKWIGEN